MWGNVCEGERCENLLLSPPGPQLRLQALQVPQTPHWHSELEGGDDCGPGGENNVNGWIDGELGRTFWLIHLY